ncbi:probable leucine-rich repeat receptor-like protein kinase At1g35710 [Macadamia integrifolia]|uniref:probable leucine-rich repeat receptor-like protein kinase At1g35710 n=1 Tax=Macadamia integrifolia TaxID=60698 RepID=UPI001C4E49A5|nr:probable leucine-rich repeat receptor-like protein kinase At1g35710 [Macadamia integrifolia]
MASFHLLSLLFFTSYALSSISTSTTIAAEDQAKALLKWKASLNNQSQSILHSWTLLDPNATNSSLRSDPCNSWDGIACNQRGSITEINLPRMGLQGMVNNFPFPSLPSLTRLDLTNNTLLGSVPSNIPNISNQFSGSIPYQMGSLKNLTVLTLFSNNLSGSVPESLRNLSNLQQLSLNQNNLIGSIPVSIGSLPLGLCMSGSPENFTAFNNHLTGLILKGFKNCSGLVRVQLENNQLVANLSEDFGIYEKLNYIDLSNNQLHGELSSTWGQCQNLQALQMAGNNITGKIPPELAMLTQLGKLDLSSNYLVGEIPKEFGKLTSFLDLTLSSNQLSGILPLEVGRLYSLTNLDLSTNSFTGQIPKEIGECSSLLYLDLSNKKFNGSIPFEIGNLVHLQLLLDLSQNRLIGEILSQFTNLRNLEKLNLSHNQLIGTIFSAFNGMFSLTSIDISYNEFEGPLPKNRAFQNATIEALRHNKALCSNVSSLQSCKSSMSKGQNGKPNHKILIAVMVPLLANLSMDQVVAVRKLHQPLQDECENANVQAFRNEICALTKLRHRNIVKHFGFCSFACHSFLVYEYFERESLAKILNNSKLASEMDWIRRINIIKGMANALSYMHHDCSPPIIHRDISSGNILLDEEYEACHLCV